MCSKNILKNFKGKFQMCIKGLCFKGVSRKFSGSFKEVSKDFQRSLKGVTLMIECNSASKWILV